jgi:hypothetical protein
LFFPRDARLGWHGQGNQAPGRWRRQGRRARDLDGEEVLRAGKFYRIESNCSIAQADGRLLQGAIDAALALLGAATPSGPGEGLGLPSTPNDFQDQESDPAQNHPDVATQVRAGGVAS